jgi:hypothetical protein
MGFGRGLRGVLGNQAEVDFIGGCRNLVRDANAILQLAAELEAFAIVAVGDKLGLVLDDRLTPIAIGRTGPSVRLEVMNAQLAPGQVLAPDGEEIAIPCERERRCGLRRGGAKLR